jgi:hypothetical protein
MHLLTSRARPANRCVSAFVFVTKLLFEINRCSGTVASQFSSGNSHTQTAVVRCAPSLLIYDSAHYARGNYQDLVAATGHEGKVVTTDPQRRMQVCNNAAPTTMLLVSWSATTWRPTASTGRCDWTAGMSISQDIQLCTNFSWHIDLMMIMLEMNLGLGLNSGSSRSN